MATYWLSALLLLTAGFAMGRWFAMRGEPSQVTGPSRQSRSPAVVPASRVAHLDQGERQDYEPNNHDLSGLARVVREAKLELQRQTQRLFYVE